MTNTNPITEVWIQLNGHSADLQAIARALPNDTGWSVEKLEDDSYVLKGTGLSPIGSDDEADKEMLCRDAGDKVAMLNGAMALMADSSYRPVSAKGVRLLHKDGAVDAPHFMKGVGVRVSAGTPSVVGDVTLEPKDSHAAQALHLSTKSLNLAQALMFLGHEPGWMGLYKVFEEVMQGAGGGKKHMQQAAKKLEEKSQRKTYQKKLERFRHTANMYRHNNPEIENPMKPDEANRFIQDLLSRYVNSLNKPPETTP